MVDKAIMIGVITDNGLTGVLQMINMQRMNVRVLVASNERRGLLHYRGGEIRNVTSQLETGTINHGIDALKIILQYIEGNYEVYTDTTAVESNIQGQHDQLLLAALVTADEESPDAPRPPEFGPDDIVDPTQFLQDDNSFLTLSPVTEDETIDINLHEHDTPRRIGIIDAQSITNQDDRAIIASVNGQRSILEISRATGLAELKVMRAIAHQIKNGTMEVDHRITPASFWESVQRITTSAIGPASLILMTKACRELGIEKDKVPVTKVTSFLNCVYEQLKPEKQERVKEAFNELKRSYQE